VVVGNFLRAGHTLAPDVATRDGQRWPPLGRLGAQTNTLTVCASPTGELICGGWQGFVPGSCVARWNGSAWEAIPATGSGVYDSRFTPDGDLLIAGGFSSVAETTAANIAIRRGGAWSPLGPDLGPGVQAMTTTASGDIIAGGDFTTAGGSPATAVADGPVEYTWVVGNSPESVSRTVGTGPTITVAAPDTPGSSLFYWCTASAGRCGSTQSPAARVVSIRLDQRRDGVVDARDIAAYLDRFESGSNADFNGDEVVDFFDLMDFLDALDRGC
jgi:hypothetical protein